MFRESIGEYLDMFQTLLPSDEDVPTLVSKEWYSFIKQHFDNIVWEDFYSRQVFINRKFDTGDLERNYQNIIKTIKIRLQQKDRLYERLYNAYMADYNPLWNVDGVTGTVRKSTHTGTDTNKKTGTDSTNYEDKGDITKSGNISNEYEGTRTKTRTGNEVTENDGNDTETTAKTTFDDDLFKTTDQIDTDYGKSETHTYNNVADTESFNNYKEKEVYNSVKDTKNLNGSDSTTYNNELKKTLNLTDEDLEMVIRQGNIGVTKSSELIKDTIDLYQDTMMDFVHYVVNDCINQVSYAIY